MPFIKHSFPMVCTVVGLMLSLSACTTAEQMDAKISAYEGNHIDRVLADFGPPTQVLDDGRGGKIYTYDLSQAYYMPGTTQTFGSAYGPNSPQRFNTFAYTSPGYTIPVEKFRMFWADRNGVVYQTSWKGIDY